MEFFTKAEFEARYSQSIEQSTIIEASEMIFAQVSPIYRDNSWNDETVPEAVSVYSECFCPVPSHRVHEYAVKS